MNIMNKHIKEIRTFICRCKQKKRGMRFWEILTSWRLQSEDPCRMQERSGIFSCEKDKNPKAYKRKGVQTQLLSGRTQQNFTGNTCSPALEQTRLINGSTTNFRVQILAGPGVARQLLQIMSVGSSMPPPFNLVLQACRLILAHLHLICMPADELYIVSYNSICEWGYMH